MTTITATNAEAEHLADALAELAARAPALGEVKVTVDDRKSRARPGHVFIDRSDVGKPWELGTLAHEYGHVLQPDLRTAIARIWAWYAVVPCVVGLAVIVPTGVIAGDVAGLLIPVWFAFWAFCWSRAARTSQPGEFGADARAAELLGPERVDSLLVMLSRQAKKTKPGSADWFSTHPNPHRRLAAVRAQVDGWRRSSSPPILS